MKIVESPHEAYAHIQHWRSEGQRIGLVPTMGALHAGHLSLIRCSKSECDFTVASIFVNPTQFGPHEDYAKYPRTLDSDFECLTQTGIDLVFVPKRELLYPEGYSTYVEPPAVGNVLEGEKRPGHFRGVATIVLKLFQVLPVNIAFFGQKDYQQLMVIRRMVDDLNVPIRIQGCETIRESDGLAMSSRNRYLSADERHRSLSLWRALIEAQNQLNAGLSNVSELESRMQQCLTDGGVDRIDYARIVDRVDLSQLTSVDRPAIALLAAYVGKTRLIDNLFLDPPR